MRGDLPDLRVFLDPEGSVPPGGIVVRPSLLAAVGSVLRFAFYAALVLVPPLLGLGYLHEMGQDERPRLPFWFLVYETVSSGVLPIAVGLAAAVLKVAFTRYVIDRDGIHVQTRLLEAEEKRIPWEKVTAVTHRRTIFDSMLGVERIDLVSFGQGKSLHLVGLRDGRPLRDLVAVRMRESSSREMLRRLD